MKFRNILLTLLTLTLFSACGGGTDLNEDFFGSGNEPPVNLQVNLIHHLNGGAFADSGEGESKIVENNLEEGIRIEGLSVFLKDLSVSPVTSSLNASQISIDQSIDLSGPDGVMHSVLATEIPDVHYESWELTLGDNEQAALVLSFSFLNDEHSVLYELSIPGGIILSDLFKAKENGEVIEHALHRSANEDRLSFMLGVNYQLLFENAANTMDEFQLAELIEANLRNQSVVHQHHHSGGHHNM